MNNADSGRRPIKARSTQWASTIAAQLAEKGVRPNYISLLSVVFSCLAGACLLVSANAALGTSILMFGLSVAFIQCRLLCNLFDGMVAIEGGFKTKSGAIFNDLPDRIADPLILVSAGYAAGGFEVGVLFGWVAGLLSVMTAYVRFLGVASGAMEYFIGPMAKQHRMAVITVALVVAMPARIWSYHEYCICFSLVLISVGCAVTIVRRTGKIIRELEGE